MAQLLERDAPAERAGESGALSRAAGDLLVLAHLYTATLVLGIGALFGMLQGFSRANLIVMPPAFDYYRMLTAHGVLMALVFTTFFITGLFTFAVYRTIPRERSTRLGGTNPSTIALVVITAAKTTSSASPKAIQSRSWRGTCTSPPQPEEHVDREPPDRDERPERKDEHERRWERLVR